MSCISLPVCFPLALQIEPGGEGDNDPSPVVGGRCPTSTVPSTGSQAKQHLAVLADACSRVGCEPASLNLADAADCRPRKKNGVAAAVPPNLKFTWSVN